MQQNKWEQRNRILTTLLLSCCCCYDSLVLFVAMHTILQCTSKWKYARACSLSSLNWRAITNGELYGYFSSSDTYFSTSFFFRYRVLQTPPCSTVHLFCISFSESVCRNVQFTEEPTSTFYYIRFLLSHQILEDWSQWLAYSVCVYVLEHMVCTV